MNRLYYLFRQLPDGFRLADSPVLFPGLVQNMLVYTQGNPVKGMDFYMNKNIQSPVKSLTSDGAEGAMQLNFPINP